jgi:RNA polymerase sigma factor (TIGR02999 family)
MNDVTQMLRAARHGEPGADERLWNIVYVELRRMAAGRMVNEERESMLQATALVHEAWLRLSDADGGVQTWDNRRHFFGAASEAMRRILVEQARARLCGKRGHGQRAAGMEEAGEVAQPSDDRLLQVHDVLDRLAMEDPVKAQLVKLRFFVGLSHGEIALLLGMSERTVRREWAWAKTWLLRAIEADPGADPDAPGTNGISQAGTAPG